MFSCSANFSIIFKCINFKLNVLIACIQQKHRCKVHTDYTSNMRVHPTVCTFPTILIRPLIEGPHCGNTYDFKSIGGWHLSQWLMSNVGKNVGRAWVRTHNHCIGARIATDWATGTWHIKTRPPGLPNIWSRLCGVLSVCLWSLYYSVLFNMAIWNARRLWHIYRMLNTTRI